MLFALFGGQGSVTRRRRRGTEHINNICIVSGHATNRILN
jgi:hypothetical protein